MAGVLTVWGVRVGWWEEKHCTIALHNSTDTHYISQSGNTREVRTQENEQQRFMPFLYSMPFGSSRLPSCVQRVRDGGEREKTRTIGPHWSTIAQHAVSVATQRQPRRDNHAGTTTQGHPSSRNR